MNKLIKVAVATFVMAFVVACDNQAQGVADFKKMIEWNQSQEQALAQVQVELQQKVATGDKAQIEEGLKMFTLRIEDVMKSLDQVEIKHSRVNEFKEKTKQTLALSNELISESVKVMSNQTPEAQKVIQEKSQALLQIGQELQELQQKLQQEFPQTAESTK